MDPRTFFAQGELILLETGEFEDHQTRGPYRAMYDFDIADACEAWCGHRPPVNLYDLYDERDVADRGQFYLADHTDFLHFLVHRGYLAPVLTRYLHIGSYNRLEI